MATMHRSGLASFDNKLVGRASGLRTRAKLLVRQIQGHDGGLGVDAVGGLELVEMCWRQNVPAGY